MHVLFHAVQYLFNRRQQNRAAAAAAAGTEFVVETVLSLGRVVQAAAPRFAALWKELLPEYEWEYPISPVITVHSQNVIDSRRYYAFTQA